MATPELTREQLLQVAENINPPLGDNPDYGHPAHQPDVEMKHSPEGYPHYGTKHTMVYMRNVFTGEHEWVPHPYTPVADNPTGPPTASEIRGEMDASEAYRLSRLPPRPTGFT